MRHYRTEYLIFAGDIWERWGVQKDFHGSAWVLCRILAECRLDAQSWVETKNCRNGCEFG